MTEEELKIWFIDKFNSCYAVKHNELPNSIFWYYDESYIRQKKLCKINNQKFTASKVRGICLFEQDLKKHRLYCDCDSIWDFFEKNYKEDYFDVRFFIDKIIEDITEFKTYKPSIRGAHYAFEIIEPNNLIIL